MYFVLKIIIDLTVNFIIFIHKIYLPNEIQNVKFVKEKRFKKIVKE